LNYTEVASEDSTTEDTEDTTTNLTGTLATEELLPFIVRSGEGLAIMVMDDTPSLEIVGWGFKNRDTLTVIWRNDSNNATISTAVEPTSDTLLSFSTGSDAYSNLTSGWSSLFWVSVDGASTEVERPVIVLSRMEIMGVRPVLVAVPTSSTDTSTWPTTFLYISI